MLELPNELLDHLKSGGTLVVPSRQRATAVRLAHSAAMLSAGLTVWSSPDVLPWSAWIERELDAARARGDVLARRLSAAEEWLLWRESVQEACTGMRVLMPDALIEPVRRAIGRLDDYGLNLSRAVSPETAVLLQARACFRRRCAELGALGSTSWRDCAVHLRPSPALLLAGFSALGPARRAWLEQHGSRLAADPGESQQISQVVSCDSPMLEAASAAQWCAGMLAHDPHSRLLLVVPRLAQQRHLWERALAQRLDAAAVLASGASRAESGFALEGGQPLHSYPLVATALNLIALAAGVGQFEQLSGVLRSPYLTALPRDPCLQLDLWLREHNVAEVETRLLRRLLASAPAGLGDSGARALRDLVAALEETAASGAASPAQWGRVFAALLQRCGWPGHTLGGDEQQVRMRFDELLGDFAAVVAPVGRLLAWEAGGLLQQMALRVAFEPASDDVPVTVTASLDDPIVGYDGIWVAGLTAESWPAAAQPDPLLPLMLQRDAGLEEASASGQLRLAMQRLRLWQQRAVRCVWSWSRSEAELPRECSPLLDETPAAAFERVDSVLPFEMQAWLVGQAPPLEAWHDHSGAAWPRGQALRGGSRLLELQSLCPFRSFAELRLRAQPLPEPLPGIDPRVRGQMLHLALELFWGDMRDSATLHRCGHDVTVALTQRCVQSAIGQIAARLPGSLDAAVLRRECARAERLIGQLIDWELARDTFQAQTLEQTQQLQIAGETLRLRLDRVDRLADGRLVVIDYKTGTAQKFDAFAARLPQPQLPAYATAVGDEVAAVIGVYLGRDGVKRRGLSDRAERVRGRGIGPVPGGQSAWPPLLQHWREQLQQLVREFLGGYAAVQPQLGACEYCHLQMLCRVDAPLLAAAAAAAGEEAQAAQAAQAIAGGGE